MTWFSKEFDTIEEAQRATGASGFFQPYGVFETPDGKFVWANLNQRQFTPEEAAAIHDGILELTGHRMVSIRDALFGWMMYHKR